MTEYICRVAVVGAQRPRVARVASMLQSTVVQHNEHISITVEYLPCIAAFGAYKNDEGAVVKYLANLSLCIDGTMSSLAPFLDEERDEGDPLELVLKTSQMFNKFKLFFGPWPVNILKESWSAA
jgi:uncharacterized protein (UPF0179 family)